MVQPQHLVSAGHTGQTTANGHSQHDDAGNFDSAVTGRVGVGPHRSDFKAQRGFEQQPPHSKGYQQRVSLAQAFLHDPPLVIVDEPTGGLDPVQRGDVRAVLRELRGDRTVLLCTHDLDEARELTSNVAVLEAGRLVAEGATNDVLGAEDALALFRPRGGGST